MGLASKDERLRHAQRQREQLHHGLANARRVEEESLPRLHKLWVLPATSRSVVSELGAALAAI